MITSLQSKMNHLEVTIAQGTLRGSTGSDIKGNLFYKFQGIPYAQPPLGTLRFKAPVPPEEWTGTFDATKEGDICYSRDPLKALQSAGSENCLVLNVFTKNISPRQLKPVMFWIHGGGFAWGHGGEELYGPDFLITADIVLVTINYRLGMFGFLSFEDSSLEIPGNAGLKDQVMALKWVQKNISKFGGDPNNVTIFGESAGGASVHLHMLSSMSKGLFHRAIAQSGCALNPWVIGTTVTKKLGRILNLADEKQIYDALMQMPKEDILKVQNQLLGPGFVYHQVVPLRVTVERNSKEPFLADEPINIIRSGNFNKVPLMLGYTSSEGMVFELLKSETEKPLAGAIPCTLGYPRDSKEIEAVVEKVKRFYFGSEEPSESNISKKYDLFSDTSLIHDIQKAILEHTSVSDSPIYMYRVSIETKLNFFKELLQIRSPGACHCDDIGYLFKHFATPEIQPGSVEEMGMNRFVKLWTNFAKFGKPSVEWTPVSGQKLEHLDIGTDLRQMVEPERERVSFWRKLFEESPAGRKARARL